MSREDRDEFGYVNAFPADKAAKMRALLKRAIEINPGFTESYELLAFVSLVTNEGLDAAVLLMRTALRLQPGSQRYTMRLAELYLRQDKFDIAAAIAEKVAKTADEPDIKGQADRLLSQLTQRKEMLARNEENRKRYEAALAARAKDDNVRPRLNVHGSDPNTQSPVPSASVRSL